MFHSVMKTDEFDNIFMLSMGFMCFLSHLLQSIDLFNHIWCIRFAKYTTYGGGWGVETSKEKKIGKKKKEWRHNNNNKIKTPKNWHQKRHRE